jgi:hypothetical protein
VEGAGGIPPGLRGGHGGGCGSSGCRRRSAARGAGARTSRC